MSIKLNLIYRQYNYKLGCDELNIRQFRDENGVFYQATLSVVELLSVPVRIDGYSQSTLVWENGNEINTLVDCEVICSDLPVEIVINARKYLTWENTEKIKLTKFRSRDIDQSKITDFMI